MHVIAEITYFCPYSCGHCPVPKKSLQMDVYCFGEALELFAEVCKRRRKLLTISGGEPTTVKELPEFVKIAKEIGYTVTVATNAYNCNLLLKAKPDYVQLSYYSDGERYAKFIKALEMIKRGELNGFIRFTLTRDNVDELYRLKEIAGDVKIFAMPIRNSPKVPDRETVLKIKRDKIAIVPSRCPAGKGQFVITPEFTVLDCIFHRKVLGRLSKFSRTEIERIIRKGKRIPPYPCGQPYY